MKVFYCDECAKQIKILNKAPRVIVSNGVVLCSKKCMQNYYDINFIPRVDLPNILDGFDEEIPSKKCKQCKVVYLFIFKKLLPEWADKID